MDFFIYISSSIHTWLDALAGRTADIKNGVINIATKVLLWLLGLHECNKYLSMTEYRINYLYIAQHKIFYCKYV